MKFSLIIPTYQVEAYLGECIESCLNQNLDSTEYEILIVNDGSTDKSGLIAADYAARYPHVRVINQENKGQSGARNTGISEAKGEYVWMIDSDDYIAPHCLKQLYDLLHQDQLDVLFINRIIFDNVSRKQDKPIANPDQGIMRGVDFLTEECEGHFLVWRDLIRREYLIEQQLLFQEKMLYEDVVFTYQLYYNVERMRRTDEVYYYYRVRRDSLVNSTDKELWRAESLIRAIKILHRLKHQVADCRYQEVINNQIILMGSIFIHLYDSLQLNKPEWREIALTYYDTPRSFSTSWLKAVLMRHAMLFYRLLQTTSKRKDLWLRKRKYPELK